MEETRFAIIDEPSGIYTVEVREPRKPLRLIDGFDTREEAEAWIRARKRALDEFSP